jgi:hypothetical protein
MLFEMQLDFISPLKKGRNFLMPQDLATRIGGKQTTKLTNDDTIISPPKPPNGAEHPNIKI